MGDGGVFCSHFAEDYAPFHPDLAAAIYISYGLLPLLAQNFLVVFLTRWSVDEIISKPVKLYFSLQNRINNQGLN